jgi:hypothetical protein
MTVREEIKGEERSREKELEKSLRQPVVPAREGAAEKTDMAAGVRKF